MKLLSRNTLILAVLGVVVLFVLYYTGILETIIALVKQFLPFAGAAVVGYLGWRFQKGILGLLIGAALGYLAVSYFLGGLSIPDFSGSLPKIGTGSAGRGGSGGANPFYQVFRALGDFFYNLAKMVK